MVNCAFCIGISPQLHTLIHRSNNKSNNFRHIRFLSRQLSIFEISQIQVFHSHAVALDCFSSKTNIS